jgi:hypothetical protein
LNAASQINTRNVALIADTDHRLAVRQEDNPRGLDEVAKEQLFKRSRAVLTSPGDPKASAECDRLAQENQANQ